MKQFNNKKGFTLIELLVVIAIIGILSSIVLVSMGSARDKARDAAIKSYMGQIRAVAEMVYDSDGSYTKLASSTDYINLNKEIVNQGGSNKVEHITSDKYCLQYDLNITGDKWCIDYTGAVGSTDVSCDGTNYNCKSD